MAMIKSARRYLLQPLQRRKAKPHSSSTQKRALDRLDQRARGESEILEAIKHVQNPDGSRITPDWKDPENARRWLKYIEALFRARRISQQENVFYALSVIETLESARILDGTYENILGPINRQIEEVERKHGLGPNEFWPKGEGPEEYQALVKDYDAALEAFRTFALEEYSLHDLAKLAKQHPAEIYRLRERGRRAIHHRDAYIEALRDVVIRYEVDARRAAEAKAYSAAITLLGAGLEGLLLLRCLKAKKKAIRISQTLARRMRPGKNIEISSWRFETLIETSLAAGWLPPFDTAYAQYDSAGMAHLLRKMRNYVHPSRQARDRAWIEAERDDWRDAEAIYLMLMATIGRQTRIRATQGSSTSYPDHDSNIFEHYDYAFQRHPQRTGAIQR